MKSQGNLLRLYLYLNTVQGWPKRWAPGCVKLGGILFGHPCMPAHLPGEKVDLAPLGPGRGVTEEGSVFGGRRTRPHCRSRRRRQRLLRDYGPPENRICSSPCASIYVRSRSFSSLCLKHSTKTCSPPLQVVVGVHHVQLRRRRLLAPVRRRRPPARRQSRSPLSHRAFRALTFCLTATEID